MKGEQRGDRGRVCLLTPAHGPVMVLRPGVEWCANQAHDVAKPIEPGLLSRQQEVLDAREKAKAQADEGEALTAATG